LKEINIGVHFFNQKLGNLPSGLKTLHLSYCFNQKLENLPDTLKTLYLGYHFNQKLENLPPNLQNLTLGYLFNQKMSICIALPKLQNLIIYQNHKLEISPFFNTTIIYVSYGNVIKKLHENYEIYSVNVWKNIFYKSINIKK